MNSYERLFNRLNGLEVDKIPNLNIVMAYAAKYAQIPYSRFCTEPECMVEANIKCHEAFGIDVVTTMSDPYAETSDFGAEIEYPYDSNPICRRLVLEDYPDIRKLKIKDISTSGRMLKRVETIERYRSLLKGVCPIVGWVEGAFAEFIDLRGMNSALTDIYDDIEFVKEVLEICTQQAILFAREQIKGGADIIGVGDAAASIISPQIYTELALPYEKRIIEEIHKAGAKVKLHICGNITPILSQMSDSGADIIDVDWMVDFSLACRRFEGKSAANGNYNPVGILLQGSKETVNDAVKDCISRCNNTAMVSAGCEVPVATPHENMISADRMLYLK